MEQVHSGHEADGQDHRDDDDGKPLQEGFPGYGLPHVQGSLLPGYKCDNQGREYVLRRKEKIGLIGIQCNLPF